LTERHRLPPTEVAHLEREYLEHREAVLAMLGAAFAGLADREELYQEAWTEILEMQARGDRLRNVRALLITIAWRRARDRLRKRMAVAVDPAGAVLALHADSAPPPDDQVLRRLDAVTLRQIIERLDPRQAAVLKMRFDWGLEPREIRVRLGVSEKRLEKIFDKAYKSVAAELVVDDGQTVWSRKQQSLLLACEMGLASAEQRKRAQRMLSEDAGCRAMLRAIRAALRDVAVVVPLPVLSPERPRPLTTLVDRSSEIWGALKQASSGLIGRGGISTGAAEQAGSAGAATFGGSAVAKAVLACLAAGGTAAVCVQSGVLGDRPAAPKREIRAARPANPATAARPIRVAQVTGRTPVPLVPPSRSKPSGANTGPVSSPGYKTPPSPAPPGSTEFGPGAVGSSGRPAVPAPAPADGGGEFGP
jgi:RNA polymerase sigma factor (sigma-70 family)